MKDILGKEIIGYEEALYLKEVGFDGKCTGYYHCGFQIKDFTHVRFRYGYTNRTMAYKIDRISIGVGNPEWGAPKENVIIISIGNKVTHF